MSQKVSLGRVEKGCRLLGTAGWDLGTSIGVSGSAVNTFQFLFLCSSSSVFSQGFWNGDGRASEGSRSAFSAAIVMICSLCVL